MKNLGKFVVFNFVSIFFGLSAVAAELKVETSLSDLNLEIGDQITYAITVISNEKITRPGPKFSPPEIKGLDYMGVSESSSTGISITNFKKTAIYKITMNINYACMKEGSFTIQSIDLDLPGGLKTREVRFKVYKKLPTNLKKKQSVVAGRRRNRMDSLLQRFMGGGKNTSNGNADFNPEFFTEVEIDKREIFEGEQLIATWYVYLSERTSLGSFDTLEFPTLRGFWKEDVSFAARFYWKPVVKNGKRYIRSVLSSYALTPYNPGSFVVDSFKLRAVVSQQSFFNQKRKILTTVSKPVIITVKALPEPKPESYFGGVGRFKVDSGKTSRKKEVLYAEPFTYTLRIIGDHSNTKLIKPPRVDTGSEFSIYNIQEEYKFVPQKLSSYKDFKYTLVPRKEGVFRLPEVKISFLDPQTEKYYDLYVKFPPFRVLPNKNAANIQDTDFSEKVVVVEEAEETIFTPQRGRSFWDYLYFHIPYSIQFIFLVLVLMCYFYFYKQHMKVEESQEQLIKILERRTHRAAEIFKTGDKKEALDELINVYSLLIGGVLGKRFGVEEAFGKAAENLPPSLKSRSADLEALNASLQKLRFGSKLETKENQDKLHECLQQFTVLFSQVRDYLR